MLAILDVYKIVFRTFILISTIFGSLELVLIIHPPHRQGSLGDIQGFKGSFLSFQTTLLLLHEKGTKPLRGLTDKLDPLRTQRPHYSQ